jgi:hypothetical protein
MRLLHSPLSRIAVLAALIGATGWFAGHRVLDSASAIDAATLRAHAPALALACAALSFATLLLAAAWIVLLDDVSPRRGGRVALVVAFAYAWLVRYVPGTVPFFAGKVYLGQRAGRPARQVVLATGVQNLIEVLAGAIVGATCIALALGVTFGGGAYVALAAVPSAALVALHPSILRRLADRGLRAVGRDPLPDGALPSVRAIATAALLTATNQILNGAAMLIVLTTVTDAGPRDLLLATGALSLAGVAGILVVLAPAGLGVREGALSGLLATRFAVDAAALASVVVRAVMIVSDLALVLLALVIDVASGAGVIASVFRRERPRAVEPRSVPAAVVPQRRSA